MSRTPYHSAAHRALREAALERDGWRCQVCGARAVLVQHIDAISEGGAWSDLSNLRSLCLDCAYERSWLPPVGGLVEPLEAA